MQDYVIDKCSNDDYFRLSRSITQFNLDHLPKGAGDNLVALGFVIRDNLKMIGGVTGKLLLGQTLSIDILWVDENYRGQDCGTRLLTAIEEKAKELKSRLVVVDTFDFQALEFYQKNGYAVFGELADSPYPGNIHYYLHKRLV